MLATCNDQMRIIPVRPDQLSALYLTLELHNMFGESQTPLHLAASNSKRYYMGRWAHNERATVLDLADNSSEPSQQRSCQDSNVQLKK